MRLPMKTGGRDTHEQHQAPTTTTPRCADIMDREDQGDLIIDESGGQGEISPDNQPHSVYPTTTPTPTSAPSPYSESEGGLVRPHSSPTPSSTTSYEQLGHNFAKPSSSALSLLANSRKQAAAAAAAASSLRYHPYFRKVIEDNNNKDDFPYGGNPSNSLVHSNGIWTPSTMISSSSSSAHSSSSTNSYANSGAYVEDFSTSPQQLQGGGPTSSPNELSVPNSGESNVANSNMAMLRGSLAAGYLYDMTVNSSHQQQVSSNSNNYHHHTHNNTQHHQQHQQQQHQQHSHQYKVEQSPSPTRPYLLPHHGSDGGGESPIMPEIHVKNAFFTQDKVDTLCDVMLRDRNYMMLESILNGLSKDIHDSENVLRARAAVAWFNGNYNLLYNILDSRVFSSRHHKELQDLYQSARYSEAGKVRGRSLGAVDKYRIRRKYSLPRTIWDGESTSYTFKDRDRKMLIEAYRRCQYPNGEIKKELQLLTGLDKKQIDNWFKNRRQRDRPHDQKPRKANKMHHHPPGDGGGLVMTPASSAGSGSTLIYANMSYQSMGEDSMDVKYNPYNSNMGPTPTLAQIKSYNEMANSPAPSPVITQKKTNKRSHKNNSTAWAKDAAALVGEKLGKRKRVKASATTTATLGGDGVTTSGESHHPYAASYSDLYNGGGISGRKVNTIVVNVGGSGGTGAEDEDDNSNPSSFHQQGGHHHHHQNQQQQYSGSCSTLMLNHHHHHHQGGLAGMGVAMGWPGWQTSSSSSMGAAGSTESSGYSPMTILPSLAASFNHPSAHHHHAMNVLNSEARIQVQA
ncbi:uncharacterized protein LOC118438719 [Folsomia candida]|uniref:uncharacterized protein LOC118438719 n=1 Tax=Folsomia candida TaxID=158441 RepID=UPI00160554EB|nr:uncharacterized protein LOC118438719 [Folsomia candida]